MTGLAFIKMHGLGNDFVIVDFRAGGRTLAPEEARRIADRRRGVGCDQVLSLEKAPDRRAHAFMRIHNADGSESGACGNGARCLAAWLMDESGLNQVVIETAAGLIAAERAGADIAVDMGPASLDWRSIPLAEPRDTNHLGISEGPLADPVGVGMGNPHAVFFVADADTVDLEDLGPRLEHHPLFPERANIEIVSVIGPDRLRMRVWERGAGITQACGSGACAALVAAARRGLTGRAASIALDGGTLGIRWLENGHVILTGPVATSFAGRLSSELVAGRALAELAS
jgi:diaminopimelate epimerase